MQKPIAAEWLKFNCPLPPSPFGPGLPFAVASPGALRNPGHSSVAPRSEGINPSKHFASKAEREDGAVTRQRINDSSEFSLAEKSFACLNCVLSCASFLDQLTEKRVLFVESGDWS